MEEKKEIRLAALEEYSEKFNAGELDFDDLTYGEKLELTADLYERDPGTAWYNRLLCQIFEGIEENRTVPVPMKAVDGGKFAMMTCADRDNPESDVYYIVVTDRLEKKRIPIVAEVKIRALIEEMNSFEEETGRTAKMLINPNRSYPITIPASLFRRAMVAAKSWLEDLENEDEDDWYDEEEETEEEDNTDENSEDGENPVDGESDSGYTVTIDCDRHIPESKMKSIADTLDTMEEAGLNHLILNLTEYIGDDYIEQIEVFRTENGYDTRLVINMDDFEWEGPLVLGDEVDRDMALEIIRQLCLEGKESGEIKYVIKHFKCLRADEPDRPEETEENEDAAESD